MPIRRGDGTGIESIRKGDGTQIAEVRKGDGTVLWQRDAIPDSVVDQFDDGELGSEWAFLNAPTSFDESGGSLSVTYSDHQGDRIFESDDWELLYYEETEIYWESFRIETQYSGSAFDGSIAQKGHIGIEDASGSRYGIGVADEGVDTFTGIEYSDDNENLTTEADAESADEIWVKAEYDGTTLTCFFDYGSSFSSWTEGDTLTTSIPTPIKIGLVGNNNTVDWRYFEGERL